MTLNIICICICVKILLDIWIFNTLTYKIFKFKFMLSILAKHLEFINKIFVECDGNLESLSEKSKKILDSVHKNYFNQINHITIYVISIMKTLDDEDKKVFFSEFLVDASDTKLDTIISTDETIKNAICKLLSSCIYILIKKHITYEWRIDDNDRDSE